MLSVPLRIILDTLTLGVFYNMKDKMSMEDDGMIFCVKNMLNPKKILTFGYFFIRIHVSNKEGEFFVIGICRGSKIIE